MGLGSRTPTTTSTRNSTTNTADSGVCAISPSDLVGYTGNALNRIKDLEQRVAELEAANVQVNQLSDLSQQVGWVGGITYAGTAGWTQTEYGTLIPPAGFYIGNVIPGYHAGFYDATGTLQLGFGTDGTLSGASYPGSNYVTFNTLTGSPGGNMTLGAISITNGSFYTWDGTDTVTITEKGVYAYNLCINGASSDLNDTEAFHMEQSAAGAWPFSFTTREWGGVVDEDGRFIASGTNIGIITTVPCTLEIQWIGADDPGANVFGGSFFQIIKLARIA